MKLTPQHLDSWLIIPRILILCYVYLFYSSTTWFMGLSDPTNAQAGFISTVVGAGAGTNITDGSNNTLIGFNAEPNSASGSGQIVIGSGAIVIANNTAFIGGTASSGVYRQGNLTTWSTTSDSRIKKNIKPLNGSLNKILSLNPVSFDYILDDNGDVGFIAQ